MDTASQSYSTQSEIDEAEAEAIRARDKYLGYAEQALASCNSLRAFECAHIAAKMQLAAWEINSINTATVRR